MRASWLLLVYVRTGGERAGDAVVDVVVEDPIRDAVERGRDRADLRQDVDAVAVLRDHPLDAAHLPLDAVQALDDRVLVGGVPVRHVASLVELNRRSRREFVTTKRLDAAIAIAATIGSSTPATASGIAATL